MQEKLRRIFGFPFDKQYEKEYNQHIVRTLYKPLLVVIVLILLLSIGLLAASFAQLPVLGSTLQIAAFTKVNFFLLVVTALAIGIAVIFRKGLLDHPSFYLVLCNGYALAILLWSTLLTAGAQDYYYMMPVYVYVSLIVALVCQLKPWQALPVFAGNFLLYFLLIQNVVLADETRFLISMLNAGFCSVLCFAITCIMYRYRTRNYYNNRVVAMQNEEISSINLQLQALVFTDELTGSRNRRFFDEMMPLRLDKYRQNGSDVAVMMLDIDYFKQYNDLYGHRAGDICLRRVVEVMRRWVPDDKGCVARYGGEEFVMLMPVSGADEAKRVAEGIRQGVENVYITHGNSKRGVVTVSIGLVLEPAGRRTALSLLAQQADKAMYHAKRSGRNQTALFNARSQQVEPLTHKAQSS